VTKDLPMLDEIVAEADEFLRQRLTARGLEAPHIVFAIAPDGAGIIRTNIGRETLRELAESLQVIVDELLSPEPDRTHH
jgi:hypothetical protein